MRAAHARAKCQNQLKQLGLVFAMYASENRGFWPALQDQPGRLMFPVTPIFPEYLTDLTVLLCPAVGEAPPGNMDVMESAAWFCDDRSFWYLGYALKDEAQGLAFVEAYRQGAAKGEGFDEDLKDGTGHTIHRLREGVARFFITDINVPGPGPNEIPVIIERPGNHEGGASILFMDGHVEFLPYPGLWPMTERFIQGLQSLDQLEK
jgi:prepilin-type processing-associated H-X9-DG protein